MNHHRSTSTKVRPQFKPARPYQSSLMRWLAGWISTHDVLIESPTGSGKTLVGMATMAMHVGRGRPFARGIIAAPQATIEDGFAPRSPLVVKLDLDGAPARVRIEPRKIRKAGDSGRSVRAVLRYLAKSNPGYVLTCTHAAFVAAMKRHVGDLGRSLLFLDESHHSEAPALKASLDSWSARGGRLIFATATPYRADGLRPVREGMKVFRRTITEQMEGGEFAPRAIEHHFVAVGRPGDAVTRREFTGKEISPHRHVQDQIIAEMVADWIRLGYPKTVVRVPILVGGSAEFVARLISAFRAVHRFESSPTRVLDATGTTRADRRRVIADLAADRERGYAESEIDVVVGIQRVLEGMDWPHCSAVFCVGMPLSLATVVQLLGRALRLKGEDHPSKDVALIRFYVPCAGGNLKNLSRDHSAHALVVTIYLCDWQSGESLLLTRIVRAAFRGNAQPLGDDPTRPDNPEAPYHADDDDQLPPKLRAGVAAVMAAVTEERPEGLTAGVLVDAALKAFPDAGRAALDKLALEMILADPEAREAAEADLSRRLRKLKPTRVIPRRKLAKIFAEVVEQFRDATLCPNRNLREVGVQVHKMTGEGMREWVEQVQPWGRSAQRPDLPSVDELNSLALAEYLQNGRWPTQKDRTLAGSTGWEWYKLFTSYDHRCGISLSQEFDKAHPDLRRNPPVRAKSFAPGLDQIAAACLAEYESTRRWPNFSGSDRFPGINMTWRALAIATSRRHGVTIPELLDARFPKLRGWDLDQLSRVAKLVFDETGRWPQAHSKPDPRLDRAWCRFDQYLRRVFGYGLTGFLDDRFPDLRLYDLDLMAEAALQIFTETGRWPRHSTGQIKGHRRTWSGFNQHLRKGGSTLPRFLDERFPDLRSWDVESSLSSALRLFQETGRWPVSSKDIVPGTQRTWLAFNWYLKEHHNITLSKFLDARFPDLRGKK